MTSHLLLYLLTSFGIVYLRLQTQVSFHYMLIFYETVLGTIPWRRHRMSNCYETQCLANHNPCLSMMPALRTFSDVDYTWQLALLSAMLQRRTQ